jgi:S-adenosylmethionine-dependent methyltransferase
MSETNRSVVRAYYAGFGEREWERLERPSDGAVEFLVTTAALERHVLPSSRVLDIGGGPGRYAIWLAERGHDVTLADFSPELLRIAREKVAESPAAARVTSIVEADACDLSRWDDASFDAVLCLGPLYHLTAASERDAAVNELARVLLPGGFAFAAVMPRLTFLKRTISLADERHHLLNDGWVRRLLDDGLFENEVPGRFSLGYGVEPGEVDGLFERHGFDRVELIAAESASLGLEIEVGNILEESGPLGERLKGLLVELSADDGLAAGAQHLIYVGRKAPDRG